MKSILFALILIPSIAFAVPDCSQEKINQVLAPATEQAPHVGLECNLKIRAGQVITKKILIRGKIASGTTIDCQGGSISPTFGGYAISIGSAKINETTWRRPTDITVKNCHINGHIHILGMAENGEGEDLKISSRRSGHTKRAQDNAPKNILLDNLVITANGGIPVYVSPGTTYVTISNSEIKGRGRSVGIYLDAESGYNTIKNNFIHLQSSDREQIAIDGSAYNRIISNRFEQLHTGGIYLYRNCGEGGTIRHQSPQYNYIINNQFSYVKEPILNLFKTKPAIFLGSRDGNRNYCGTDNGYPYGSSLSNKDYALHNVVAQNRITNKNHLDVIVTRYRDNFFYSNTTGNPLKTREAGCFFAHKDYPQFVESGAYAVLNGDNIQGLRSHCLNGEIIRQELVPNQKIPFACQQKNLNKGCFKMLACPNNKKVVGLRVICDLELGEANHLVAAQAQWGLLKVIRASDNINDGICQINSTHLKTDYMKIPNNLIGEKSFSARCKEHDKNGGDCEIAGEYLCL